MNSCTHLRLFYELTLDVFGRVLGGPCLGYLREVLAGLPPRFALSERFADAFKSALESRFLQTV